MTRRSMFPSAGTALVTEIVNDLDLTRNMRLELNTLTISWRQLSTYKRVVKHFQEQGGVLRYGMKTFDFHGLMYLGVEVDAEGWLMHELAIALDDLNNTRVA